MDDTDDSKDIATCMTNICKHKYYNPAKPVNIESGGVRCFNCNIPRHRLFINYYCAEDLCKKCCKLEYVHYFHDIQCKECLDKFDPDCICIHCDLCRLYCCNCVDKTIRKLKDYEIVDDDVDDLVNDDLTIGKFKKNK